MNISTYAEGVNIILELSPEEFLYEIVDEFEDRTLLKEVLDLDYDNRFKSHIEYVMNKEEDEDDDWV